MSASIYPLNAMKDAGVQIAAVHIDQKYVVFSNGVRLKIQMFDQFHDPVDDAEDAVYYEFGNWKFGFGCAGFSKADIEEWVH